MRAKNFQHNPKEIEQNVGKRDLISSESIDLYVDPSEGNDDNAGTQKSPLLTFLEALQRPPYRLMHRTRIHLLDGLYNHERERIEEGSGIKSAPHLINYTRGLGAGGNAFEIVGNTEDPSAVEIPQFSEGGADQINLALAGFDSYDTLVKGITFNSTVLNRGGAFRLKDCRFKGNGRKTTFSVGSDGGTLHVDSCEFVEGGGSDVGIYTKDLGQISVENVRGHVAEHAYYTQRGGHIYISDNATLTGELGQRRVIDPARDFGEITYGQG